MDIKFKMTPEVANRLKLFEQEARMRFADISDDTFSSEKFSFKI